VESLLLFDDNTVLFSVLGSCVFDEGGPEFKKVVHESNWAVVVGWGGVPLLLWHVVLGMF
jgi:hypothetical protein